MPENTCNLTEMEVKVYGVKQGSNGKELSMLRVEKVAGCQHMIVCRDKTQIGAEYWQNLGVDFSVPGARENHLR